MVNLGIVVVEIVYDGEIIDNKWDLDEKYLECCYYLMFLESLNKWLEFVVYIVVEYEDFCRLNFFEFLGFG